MGEITGVPRSPELGDITDYVWGSSQVFIGHICTGEGTGVCVGSQLPSVCWLHHLIALLVNT